MGDQDAHPVEARDLLTQGAAQVHLGRGVDRRQGLVEEQEAGLGDERPGQGHALLLAAADRAGTAGRVVLQAEALQPLVGAAPCRHPRHPARAQPERDVVEHREVGEEGVVLEDDAHSPRLRLDPGVGGGVLEHLAVEHDVPVATVLQPGEDAQHGGLAGSIGAQHCDRLPRLDVDRAAHLEATQGHADVGVEAHATAPSQRSRSPTRTATEITSRISDRVIARDTAPEPSKAL